MNPIRVLIADDHAVVRRGIRHILETTPDLKVVAERATARSCWKAAQGAFDVVLMDVTMPATIPSSDRRSGIFSGRVPGHSLHVGGLVQRPRADRVAGYSRSSGSDCSRARMSAAGRTSVAERAEQLGFGSLPAPAGRARQLASATVTGPGIHSCWSAPATESSLKADPLDGIGGGHRDVHQHDVHGSLRSFPAAPRRPASATTLRSGVVSRMCLIPRRTTAWSSAISTLLGFIVVVRVSKRILRFPRPGSS